MTVESRKSGIDVVGEIPWGTHFCHFYETKDDLLDVLVPYFTAGLDGNEFCMWVVFDPLNEEEAKNALRRAVPEAERRLAAGDMEIVPHTEWYLKNGAFETKRAIDSWKEKFAQALARGYEGMRVNGIEAWLTQNGWKDFSAYEKELDNFIKNQRITVLCTYPLAITRAAEFFDVARAHQYAIARRRGKWEVVETSEQVRVKSELSRLNEKLQQCVVERTRELAGIKEDLQRQIIGRERADEALRKSEEEIRTLFAAMEDVVLVLDSKGRYLKIAPTNPLSLYRPSEELLGRKIHEILPKEDADMILHQIQQALESRQAISFEYRLNIGSSEVWFDGRISPLPDNTVFWFARDITERKQADKVQAGLTEQLLQAQRLESVGRLAGGVAHDFNNILAVILGYTELALMQLSPQHPVHKHLREVLNAAERSADLVRRLLAFARRQIVNPVVLDLNDTVSGMLKMLGRLIREDINLAWVPGKNLWKVMIDPSQVDQILTNLMVNARDAIEGVGQVAIETSNVVIDETYRVDHPYFVPGEYVLLAVSDNGTGMDKETLDLIFEPFFSTKEVDKGTGLGLSTVYGIVKQCNGFINVYSEPGMGSIFKIYLPRHKSETIEVEEASAVAAPPGGTETVLIVEDEASMLKIAIELLQRLGYTVLAANLPGEAIRLAEEYEGEIDLIITDLVMPEINGPQLRKRLMPVRPRMKCLYMSGYSENVISHQDVLTQGIPFIQKPFSIKELAEKVREALDQKTNGG